MNFFDVFARLFGDGSVLPAIFRLLSVLLGFVHPPDPI